MILYQLRDAKAVIQSSKLNQHNRVVLPYTAFATTAIRVNPSNPCPPQADPCLPGLQTGSHYGIFSNTHWQIHQRLLPMHRIFFE